MFNLKTSAPDTYRLSIRLSAELEGPSVARIFVERFLFIDVFSGCVRLRAEGTRNRSGPEMTPLE